MKLESSKVLVSKSVKAVAHHLSIPENYRSLMPDNLSRFELLDDRSFVFSLQGMPEIGLKIKEGSDPNQIVLESNSDKLAFSLVGLLKDTGAESSELQLVFEGDFNPMVAMMIKGPISKFIETVVQNAAKI